MIVPDSQIVAARRAESSYGVPPRAMGLLSAVALLSLLARHGFALGTNADVWFQILNGFLGLTFALELMLAVVRRGRPADVLRHRVVEYVALFVIGGMISLCGLLPEHALRPVLDFLHQPSPIHLTFGLVQLFLVSAVSIQLLRLPQRILVRGVRAELVLAGSFGVLIVVGTLLLVLPRASANPASPLSLMDALFTATSAACVTGLSVRDLGTEFSMFGQMLVLGLFQIGGLGIITFVALISVFSARSLPVPQLIAYRQIVNAPNLSEVKKRIVGIVILTLLIECCGAAAFYLALDAPSDSFEKARWSVFHAVSAFCNAGFSLHSTGFERFSSHVSINVITMTLIILGGLGFLVIPDLIQAARRLLARRLLKRRLGLRKAGPAPRLSIQSKLSLVLTAWLIVVGAAGFWILEAGDMLAGKTFLQSAMISMFQSVTTRTAGFNTVPIGDLQQPTLVLMTMLMVIGASPVSTGGGIKTVTFAILLLALRSMITGVERVEVWGRTLPIRTLLAALSMFVIYMMSVVASLFLLLSFDPHLPIRDALFEVISALSTVGLSTGITADLSAASKLVLCADMIIGRIGPISLVLSVFAARERFDYAFPEEEVVVG
jgi:potassium uptake TrkH family protein